MVVLHKNGKLRARDQSGNTATLYQLEECVGIVQGSASSCICVIVSQDLCVVEFVFLFGNFDMYFCISVFATMQRAARGVANVELNYGEIMQPAKQATCLHYTLQPTSIPIKQECSVSNGGEIINRQVSSKSMWH